MRSIKHTLNKRKKKIHRIRPYKCPAAVRRVITHSIGSVRYRKRNNFQDKYFRIDRQISDKAFTRFLDEIPPIPFLGAPTAYKLAHKTPGPQSAWRSTVKDLDGFIVNYLGRGRVFYFYFECILGHRLRFTIILGS